MKYTTKQDLLSAKIRVKESLQSFYECGKDENLASTEEDHADVMNAIKIIASLTNELICMVKTGW